MNKISFIIFLFSSFFLAHQSTFAAQKKVNKNAIHGLDIRGFTLPGQVEDQEPQRAKNKKKESVIKVNSEPQKSLNQPSVELQSRLRSQPTVPAQAPVLEQDPYLDNRVTAVRAHIEILRAAIDHPKYDGDKIVLAQHRLKELMAKLEKFNPHIANNFKQCIVDLEKKNQLHQAINNQALKSSQEKARLRLDHLPRSERDNPNLPQAEKQRKFLTPIDESNTAVFKTYKPLPSPMPRLYQHSSTHRLASTGRKQLNDYIAALNEQRESFRLAIETKPYNYHAIKHEQDELEVLWHELDRFNPSKASEFGQCFVDLDKKLALYNKINNFKIKKEIRFSEKGVRNFSKRNATNHIDELESYIKKPKNRIKSPQHSRIVDHKHTAENSLKDPNNLPAPSSWYQIKTIPERNEALHATQKDNPKPKIKIGNLYHKGKPEDLFNIIESRLKKKYIEFIKKRALIITAAEIQGNEIYVNFTNELYRLDNALNGLKEFNATNKALAEKIAKLKEEINLKLPEIDAESKEQYLDYFQKRFEKMQAQMARDVAKNRNDIEKIKIHHGLEINNLKKNFLCQLKKEVIVGKYNELVLAMDAALKPLILVAKKVVYEAFDQLEKKRNEKEHGFFQINNEIKQFKKHLDDLAELDQAEADLFIKQHAPLAQNIEKELDEIFNTFERDYKPLVKRNSFCTDFHNGYKDNINIKIALLRIIEPQKAQKYERSFILQSNIIYHINLLENASPESIAISRVEDLKKNIDQLKALNFHSVESYEKQYKEHKEREEAKLQAKKKEVRDKINTHTQSFNEKLARFKAESYLGAAWQIKKEMQEAFKKLDMHRILDWHYIEPSLTSFQITCKKMQRQLEECTSASKAPRCDPKLIDSYVNAIEAFTKNWDKCFKKYDDHCLLAEYQWQNQHKKITKPFAQFEFEQRKDIERLAKDFRVHNVQLGDSFSKDALALLDTTIAPHQLLWKELLAQGEARLQKALKELNSLSVGTLNFPYFERELDYLEKFYFMNIAQLKAALHRKKLEAKLHAHVAHIEAQLAVSKPDLNIIDEQLKALCDYRESQKIDDPHIRYVEKVIADTRKKIAQLELEKAYQKIANIQKRSGLDLDQEQMRELFAALAFVFEHETDLTKKQVLANALYDNHVPAMQKFIEEFNKTEKAIDSKQTMHLKHNLQFVNQLLKLAKLLLSNEKICALKSVVSYTTLAILLAEGTSINQMLNDLIKNEIFDVPNSVDRLKIFCKTLVVWLKSHPQDAALPSMKLIIENCEKARIVVGITFKRYEREFRETQSISMQKNLFEKICTMHVIFDTLSLLLEGTANNKNLAQERANLEHDFESVYCSQVINQIRLIMDNISLLSQTAYEKLPEEYQKRSIKMHRMITDFQKLIKGFGVIFVNPALLKQSLQCKSLFAKTLKLFGSLSIKIEKHIKFGFNSGAIDNELAQAYISNETFYIILNNALYAEGIASHALADTTIREMQELAKRTRCFRDE